MCAKKGDIDSRNQTADRISMEDLGKGDAEQPVQQKEVSDGPVQHKSVFRLSVLDVLANFCVTMGFFAIGSGVKIQEFGIDAFLWSVMRFVIGGCYC